MWKDFFYFTKSERQGIIVLAVLILGVFATPWILKLFSSKEETGPPEQALFDKEYKDFEASIRTTKQNKEYNQYTHYNETKRTITLQIFDPNTADSTNFLDIGLSPFLTSNILRYRRKKGIFRKKEDFRKLYGLSEEQYSTLSPYILINTEQNIKDTASLLRPLQQEQQKIIKYTAGTLVDLNKADTTELKKIPGIGSRIATMIVNRRNILGGFYRIEQLEEIRLKSEILRSWFTIDASDIQQINLNKASLERMKNHPYINYYQAKVIVEYRKKKGKLNNLKQLSLYDEFTPEDLERIAPYVEFD